MLGKGLTVSTDSAVRFPITVNRSGIIQLGPGFRLPAARTDDFGDTVTADLAAHLWKVGDHIIADQFQKLLAEGFLRDDTAGWLPIIVSITGMRQPGFWVEISLIFGGFRLKFILFF